MNWIRVDVALSGHPKVRRLAALLGQPLADAHLVRLWMWSAQYATRGDLSSFDALDIAIACGWSGDPTALLDALIACRWIDITPEGGMVLHDWMDHQGGAIEKAERDAERKRDARRGGSASPPAGRPPAPPARPIVTPAAPAVVAPAPAVAAPSSPETTAARAVHAPSAGHPSGGAALAPVRTDGTDGRNERTNRIPQGCAGLPARAPDPWPPPPDPAEVADAEEFEAFWQAYPAPRKRPTAERAWLETKPKRPPLPQLLSALAALAASPTWSKEGGRYIPAPAQWLLDEGWTERPPARADGYLPENAAVFTGGSSIGGEMRRRLEREAAEREAAAAAGGVA